ncbi:hypothetical protein [Thermodesulfatator atlanticus]
MLKPKVPKKWLYFVAGSLWMAVGLMLSLRATFAAIKLNKLWAWSLWSVAYVSSYFFGKRILSRIAFRNIKRLDDRDASHLCLFAFQPWKSYLIITIMICLGVFIRKHPLPYWEYIVVYGLMGGALITASLNYFQAGRQRISNNRQSA